VADPTRYDGLGARELQTLLAVPHVELLAQVSSTLDVAHTLAANGAPAGTVVLAEEQTAGRGREGRRWASPRGAGIWLTLLERPLGLSALSVLSLRVGLGVARALDHFTTSPVALKWPNDLYLDRAKLGGILIESRWREELPDWTAIGIGINTRTPDGAVEAAVLRPGTDRLAVLAALVPALRAAASAPGLLSAAELDEYETRDLARGRTCREPGRGVVRGISANGALLIGVGAEVIAYRSGSLVLEDGRP
jgi:BirA family transcriptional regulator, biotin operon repressor / biotin---[acetyl-CoA-carboxylase] ligase